MLNDRYRYKKGKVQLYTNEKMLHIWLMSELEAQNSRAMRSWVEKY